MAIEPSQDTDDETTPSTTGSDHTPTDTLGGRARSLANLRPPWPKGRSGNARGTASDGGSAVDHPIRATLRKRLAKRRAMERLVDSWIDAACDGDSAAREQILKRLDPIVEDVGAGRTILEGIRLELTPTGASVTLARGSAAPTESVAVPELSESRTGAQPTLDSVGHETLNTLDLVPPPPPLELVSGVPPSTSTPVFDPARGGGSNGVVLA